MTLEVMEMNGLATIQDSGRTGWRRFGVPSCGPMDRFAFNAANALVGNPLDYALIEIGLGDITFRASQDCVVAVSGAGYGLSIYIWDFPLWSSFFVRSGWTVRLNKTDDGMWAYLAVAGGVQTSPMLGSQSTYLRGALGGFEGRGLQTGDHVRAGSPSRSLDALAARSLPLETRPAYSDIPSLDVILGPQTNYFSDAGIETFLSNEYVVSLTSDRMGYRLEGPALSHRGKTELISEGMMAGAVQVPSSGQPIVMMADCPTTGGYPKIATVAGAALPALAQCVPNKSRIRFQEITVAKAQKKYRALMGGLESRVVKQDDW
jgi:antagonist of KipI